MFFVWLEARNSFISLLVLGVIFLLSGVKLETWSGSFEQQAVGLTYRSALPHKFIAHPFSLLKHAFKEPLDFRSHNGAFIAAARLSVIGRPIFQR